MYDENEEIEDSFKTGVDEDEPLDMLEEINDNDFGLDEEDPDRDG